MMLRARKIVPVAILVLFALYVIYQARRSSPQEEFGCGDETRGQVDFNSSLIQPIPVQLKGIYKPGKSCPELHLISTFPLLTNKDINTTSYARCTPQKMQERMSEFMTGLQRNLHHPCVHRLYFLYNETLVKQYVEKHLETDREKLFFQRVIDPRNQTMVFDFAFSSLQDKIVIFTPAEVYLGEGFELLDKKRLDEKKLMYSLTRYGTKEKNCDMSKQASSNSCDDRRYMGSHDAYIFVPSGKFPPKLKHFLSFSVQAWGSENVSIWAFRKLGNYTVTNPCKVLKSYHLHCSGVRDARRVRISTPETSGLAEPTDVL